MKSVESEMYFS